MDDADETAVMPNAAVAASSSAQSTAATPPRAQKNRTSPWIRVAVLVLLLLLAGLAGTGLGCSSHSTTVKDIGTPLGVATQQVTATAYVNNAVVAQTLNFTVNVQP